MEEDDDWSPENKAYLLFGHHMWHTIVILREKFVPGKECRHEGCSEPATKRIMVNVWGTVAEFDACEKHAKQFHGKNVDEFPAKPW